MAEKYTQEQIDALGAKGHAFKNPDGSYSYPIDDAADLENAIRAVGRGNADHDAIRKYIIGRADAMGLKSKIPDNWSAGGSIQQANAADTPAALSSKTVEWRRNKAPVRGSWERREFTAPVELREDGNDTITLTGYASVTGVPYDVGFYEETIAPGAFKRTLNQPQGVDVQLLVNHTGLPLARTTSGTLRLAEDSRGLSVEADLDPSDPDVQSLLPKIRRGDASEMSFAFRATEQDWSEDYTQRTILAAEIHRGDVSVVSYGASPSTSLSLRSEEALQSLQGLGADAFVAALLEWRDYRVGKTLSASTVEALTTAANLFEEGHAVLSDLMSPSPDDPTDDDEGDDDENTGGDGEDGGARSASVVVPDYVSAARQRFAELVGRVAG